MKKFLAVIICSAMLFAACSDGFAKGGRSSGGSRSSSSSSRSSSSSWGSRSSSSSSSSRPSAPSSGGSSWWGGKSSSSSNSRPSTATNSTPSYSQKAKAANQSSGKSFSSKADATAAFKKDNAGKFSSKYDKEPATRPSHIPQSTKVGNQNVNINYNSTYGGYGYMHPTLGTWIMYDMMSDAVMMSAMMHSHGYHVGAPVAPGGVVVAPTYSPWRWFWGVLFTIILLCIIPGLYLYYD